MQNKKGFIGLIAMLIVVAVAAIWMVYLLKNDWFGGSVKVPSLSGGNSQPDGTTPDVTQQLDNLRQDVKTLQDKKDQEIMNELNK